MQQPSPPRDQTGMTLLTESRRLGETLFDIYGLAGLSSKVLLGLN
jgi:hypothetical protein